ncbi:hypothetical protein CKAH01_18579 [Colletotrichum kahawae]|uniref:Uncharacterized protein n=1 Tax=Colletotrichum kahawae TaxID=34407 RepID=A0AAE0D236_COLKA|nr:hypothetical protein CKAH01_18579 [Colletotrichum kahawae]
MTVLLWVSNSRTVADVQFQVQSSPNSPELPLALSFTDWIPYLLTGWGPEFVSKVRPTGGSLSVGRNTGSSPLFVVDSRASSGSFSATGASSPYSRDPPRPLSLSTTTTNWTVIRCHPNAIYHSFASPSAPTRPPFAILPVRPTDHCLPSISSRVNLLSSHSSPWTRLCNRTPIITTSPPSPASSSTVSPFPSPSPRLSNASSPPLQPQTPNLPLESAEKNGSILVAKPGPFRGLTTSLALPSSTSQRRRIIPLPPPPTT